MKNATTAILMMACLQLQAQCKDIYGSRSDCATAEDSLTLYNNALRVVQFYDSNKLYRLQDSRKLSDNSQVREVFDDLTQARRMFNIIRTFAKQEKPDKFSVGQVSPKYKDIKYSQYYTEIDDYRFYQRELENQIVNKEAPMSMYDIRIAPIMVNSYICEDKESEYYNDLVNIPLYVPVVVKPFALLTETEIIIRNKILDIPMPIKFKRVAEKRDSIEPKKLIVKNEQVQEPTPIFYDYEAQRLPIYLYNNYGSACVIGFMVGRKFQKLKREQYAEYAVSTFARNVLEDDVALDKVLRVKFGAYYEGILH